MPTSDNGLDAVTMGQQPPDTAAVTDRIAALIRQSRLSLHYVAGAGFLVPMSVQLNVVAYLLCRACGQTARKPFALDTAQPTSRRVLSKAIEETTGWRVVVGDNSATRCPSCKP